MDYREKMEIYEACEKRWDVYEKMDGGYYPSKHDELVLKEVAQKYNLDVKKVKEIHDMVSKVKAEIEIKGMSKEQGAKEFEKVLRKNKETPWGKGII